MAVTETNKFQSPFKDSKPVISGVIHRLIGTIEENIVIASEHRVTFLDDSVEINVFHDDVSEWLVRDIAAT